ncbi:hypothetical protein EDD85DRAFT_785284 [Armillaria nabsnona]|nr:hypothetical protein EDD85DRAFT_785284 [Armillaria nabsnona]
MHSLSPGFCFSLALLFLLFVPCAHQSDLPFLPALLGVRGWRSASTYYQDLRPHGTARGPKGLDNSTDHHSSGLHIRLDGENQALSTQSPCASLRLDKGDSIYNGNSHLCLQWIYVRGGGVDLGNRRLRLIERNQRGSTIVSEIHSINSRKEFTRHEPESDKRYLTRNCYLTKKMRTFWSFPGKEGHEECSSTRKNQADVRKPEDRRTALKFDRVLRRTLKALPISDYIEGAAYERFVL